MLHTVHQFSLAANGYTPWVDCRRLTSLSVQTSCGDVNDPAGTVVFEGTNDIATVEKEQQDGTAPSVTAANKVVITVTPSGSAFSNGYDGVGAKSSLALNLTGVAAAFVRIRYSYISGGAGDTMTVRWVGKIGY